MKAHLSSKLFLRASLLTALLTGLTVIGLNYTRVRQKIERLQAELAAQTTIAQKAENNLSHTQTELARTGANLKVSMAELKQVTADKQAVSATAAELTSLTQKQSVELISMHQDLQEAQRSLGRYRTAGLEPEQISGAASRIKKLEKAVIDAERSNLLLAERVKDLTTDVYSDLPVMLPAGLQGKVISTDAKWRFLVLDVGANKGVLENGELLVRRGDRLVGKAKVSRVQGDRCVANVMSGWDFSEIREGDVAIPAMPRSQRENASGS